MAEKSGKNYTKSLIQFSIGLTIALMIVGVSWVSKHTSMFPFYELIELKLLDQRFLVRGSIPMNPNVGTIDIDAISLESEGRYQDWTRDKYADVIRTLKDLDIRMIGFDMFFVESSGIILKKEIFNNARVENLEDISQLFRDYDEELRQAMIYADNVILGQAFTKAENQDGEWVKNNTVVKDVNKISSGKKTEGYYKEYEDWLDSEFIYYVDIEPPLQALSDVSRGVGYAMTESDIDGSVRHYPIVLAYDGKIWPSLALAMILEYIDVEFKDVEIVPGKEIILPPGKLPDGTEINITIPMNNKGLMMVNWAGDWGEDQFFHIPHIALIKNKQSWEDAAVAKVFKDLFQEQPELIADIDALIPLFEEKGIEFSDGEFEIYNILTMGLNLEEQIIDEGVELDPEGVPEDLYDFYQELVLNHKIADAFEENPSLSLDEMKNAIDEQNEAKIRRGYYIIKDKFDKGGLNPNDYPLYFFDPEVDGKILTKDDFKGKVFIYGLTAPGTHDLNPMPYSQRYPMVGLYANIFNTIISQNYLERVPFSIDALIIIFFGLLMGIFIPKLKQLTGVLSIITILIGYLVVAQYLFQGPGWWVDVLGPVTVIIIGFTSITAYSFFAEEKEKKMIRGMFSRIVDKSVVDELIKNPDMVKPGGEKKNLTVFFSDVAGFTSVSEKLSPEDLVLLLNEYLDKMTNIVLKYQGMIDKYEGDAIMAVFGTPIMFDDHATRACYVSLEMQEELAKLREKWKKEGKPELKARIGLSTGEMVAGFMGATVKLEYTVMGDSVNLGSRLEGANKQYNTYIMISEYTYEAAKNDIEVRFLDSLRVKGKKLPVKVYELLGRKDVGISDEMQSVRKNYDAGVEKYLVREWDAGLNYFNKALSVSPEDGPSNVYVERCLAFKENPPPDDWDGVYVMTSK